MKVWLLVLTNRLGDHITAHKTYEGARRALLHYCYLW
jgi:hypothetical protein